MTQTTVDELIVARATDMAAHDGDVLNSFYVMAATNQLIAEVLAARDRIIAHPPVDLRVAGAAHAPAEAEPAIAADLADDSAPLVDDSAAPAVAAAGASEPSE